MIATLIKRNKGIQMQVTKVLDYLKKHGQLLDFDIAAATNISIEEVRASLAELSARGDISQCSVTTHVKGKTIEGFQCRLSGYIPRPAPGRKPAIK
jgi:transcription initiation factor IIE alpha subunit